MSGMPIAPHVRVRPISSASEVRELNAHIWERDPHDWYVESEWCSERLFAEEKFGNVFDPACGSGRIVRAARAAGLHANGSDIIDRGADMMFGLDFLSSDWPAELAIPEAGGDEYDFISNPPFKLADRFVRRALDLSRGKVAMLLPATWHFGSKRAAWLATTPLARILALTPRPSMPPGAVIAAGQKPGGGTKDFAWYIWERGHVGPWVGGWLHRDGPIEIQA